MDKSKVYNIKEAVKTGKESVVSRVVMKSNNGNISLFAFDKGEGLSKHSAPFDAMVLVLEGSVMITIGENENRLNEGEAILMPADIPHELTALTPFKMMLTMIKGE